MKTFSTYLIEAFLEEQLDVDKLKHLEHVEDHPIHAGEEGYHHAVNTLHNVHHLVTTKHVHPDLKVTTKYDGSPSVVYGHHPESGKFFVATKSAFNANPKINYTHADIEANHGHAPGLVTKLKHALDHLPKITPKHGVYQGDIMHSEGDVQTAGSSYHFRPNTITYSTPVKSKEGEKIAKSKIGIVTHTKYSGPSLESMKAGFHVDHENFGHHNDVHHITPEINHKNLSITPEQDSGFSQHMKKAESIHNKLKGDGYEHVTSHQLNLKTYVNSTIRNNSKPSTDGYKNWLTDRGNKEAERVKNESNKASKKKMYNDLTNHIEKNKEHFDNAFALHHHIQSAKNHLVNALANGSDYGHSVDGTPTKPEGFVATYKGRPSKLVDRHEFSRLNFNRNRE